MIVSFHNKATEELYITGKNRQFSKMACRIAFRKLTYLNHAKDLNDLRVPPGNRLEKLKGEYAGKYSIRINDQYRIVFGFAESQAYDVEIVDYH
jgi:proteic killer suppression protein